ncbi:7-carboxy-7-deazaguanine synthase QueE [Myxococcota bacterium]|nr:7-carboxy-7-deazaguanine synthase QueE [Myxococcota bacterium]MBU1535599.1 7-carboxy-7-deazaguanine synthase QueE [Myxococcota bacterium]
MSLKVYEIFKSLQGESSFQGLPCVFIRLAGCHLNCSWCDTAVVRTAPGIPMEISDIINRISVMGARVVEVTGGEPLLQDDSFALLSALNDYGFTVLLETSGACPLDKVDPRTHIVMDVKPPSSGEASSLCEENFARLDHLDEVKFPCASREDFDNAMIHLRRHEHRRWRPLFTPVTAHLEPSTLASWVLTEGPPDGRFQLQLHKVIGLP